MEKFIKKFSEISINDTAIVGGKNASLGEMFTQMVPKGNRLPDGFAITAAAFKYFLQSNKIDERLHQLLGQLDRKKFSNLAEIG